MYSISGFPLLVSSGPLPAVTGGWPLCGTDPAPTVLRALAGTLETALDTLAGRGVRPFAPAADVDDGLLSDRMTIKATTMTITASTLPPVMNRRLRLSARRSASRCAAIFCRAFCCLILVALLIVSPQKMIFRKGDAPQSMVGRGRGWPCRAYRRRTAAGVLTLSAAILRMIRPCGPIGLR